MLIVQKRNYYLLIGHPISHIKSYLEKKKKKEKSQVIYIFQRNIMKSPEFVLYLQEQHIILIRIQC